LGGEVGQPKSGQLPRLPPDSLEALEEAPAMAWVPIPTVIQAAQRAALQVVSLLRQLQKDAGAEYVLPPLDLLIEYWVEFSPFRPWRRDVSVATQFFTAVRPSRGVRLYGHRAGSAHEVVVRLTAELHDWLSRQESFQAIAAHLNNTFLGVFGADHAQWNEATQLMSIALWLPPKEARPFLDRPARRAAANPGVRPFYQGVNDIYRLFVSNRKWDGTTFLEKAKAVPPERYHALAAELEERVAELKLDVLERQLRWEASRALLRFPGPPAEANDAHKKIPPENRTKPLSLKEAARWMGYGRDDRAVKNLRAAMDTGAVAHEKLTRQRHIFSRLDFPRENWPRVIPTQSNSC
jgi:hypothetical protein